MAVSASPQAGNRRYAKRVAAGVIGIRFLAIRTFVANKSAKAAGTQARTAEQGHITDRFTAAVEQLDSDKMTVRLVCSDSCKQGIWQS